MKIQSQSPSRLSLCGGGTDFPEYYQKYGGAVISLAIDIRSRFTLDTNKTRGKNANVEGGDPTFITDILKEFGVKGTFDMVYDGRLRSGLGGSASSAVAVVGAINEYLNLGLDKTQIAMKAYDLEVKKLFGGVQDQMASSHGGLNFFEFGDKVTVNRLNDSYGEKLASHLLLFHTGIERTNSKIQEGFKTLSKTQIIALGRIKSLVAPMTTAVIADDVDSMGEILNAAWTYKKQSNLGVTNPKLAQILNYSKHHGALGFKVCGAGGGGFVIFVVKGDQEVKQEFIKKMELNGLTHYEFKPDFKGLEVRVL